MKRTTVDAWQKLPQSFSD